MAVDIVMPQMGESIFEGTIPKWLKKPGDKVERDEPLFEISTDKVDAEIPSPSAGVLKEIKVTEGQTVPINTVVAVIDAAGAAAAAPAPPPAKAAPATAPVPVAVAAAQRVAPPPVAPAPLAGGGGPAAHGTQYVPALQLGVPRERVYFGDYEVEPLSNMRLKIAEHMVASKHVSPHVYSVDEIDMTKIASLRAKSKDEFERNYG